MLNFDNSKIQENLNKLLGKQYEKVLHSIVPFDFGYDVGGASDVYIYKNHINGIVYITGDLFGKEQAKSDAGNYEFMICHSEEDSWGPNLISKLSYYSIESSINSGETMNIGAFAKSENTIKAIIFDKYAEFIIDECKYGIMLIIGITSKELEWAKKNGGKELLKKLKEYKIYPITNLKRESILL